MLKGQNTVDSFVNHLGEALSSLSDGTTVAIVASERAGFLQCMS